MNDDDNILADGGLSSNKKFDTHETHTVRKIEIEIENDRKINTNR
jgi:hypothetical protein